MACTTILVGKNASYDGSTMIARNDDCPSGQFHVKKVVYVDSKDQPKIYKSKISHVEIELPSNPIGYTMTPNVDSKEGIWPASGINKENVAMTATETITSNPLVLAADPLVEYKKATPTSKEVIGGIGEEDLVCLVLPYIHSAREGVIRLGELLEKYGTYESNGIAFADKNEVWYLETIGGHHFMAVRLKDNHVAVIPNQLSIDHFDFKDANSEQKEFICSKNLESFMKKHHINFSSNPRTCLGSHSDSDHVYNTPRSWYGTLYFNKDIVNENNLTPTNDNIPFSVKPLNKVTIEDVKYVLGSYYQNTPYNPYSKQDNPAKGIYRPIGINRTSFMSILQIRDYVDKPIQAIEWISFACNAFNTFIPIYTNVDTIPSYLSNTTLKVDTSNFYWASRLCSALSDPHFSSTIIHVERYQNYTMTLNHMLINKYDKKFNETKDINILKQANQESCDQIQECTNDLLDKLLYEASMKMKNSFSRSDN